MNPDPQRRPENLAFCYQELLTVGERLRSDRQRVEDAASFRYSLLEALRTAEEEARRRGYKPEDIHLSSFAVVAFLDESILNRQNPIFADWPRQPLQEELFGHHVAGEIFFQHLAALVRREETQETADVLEIYYLCLTLGFAGKYGIGARGELKAIMDAAGDRIRRIRRLSPELSPHWSLPRDAIRSAGADPWVRRLGWAAVICVLFALVLFAAWKFSLGSAVERMAVAAGTRS